MREVIPELYVINLGDGHTGGMDDYCEKHGFTWRFNPAISTLENTIVFGGKLCYGAFQREDGTYDNENLTRTREDYKEYIGNVIKQGHGSIFEHGPITVLFENVSRVFTHEIVRHRVGTAMSQTSGRYVSNDDIAMWFPNDLKEDAEAYDILRELVGTIEEKIGEATKILGLREMTNFAKKKALTSALRRLAPNGQANNIMFSFNLRALRHMIGMRSAAGAEVEIAILFTQLGAIMKERFPFALQDMTMGDDGFWHFEYQC